MSFESKIYISSSSLINNQRHKERSTRKSRKEPWYPKYNTCQIDGQQSTRGILYSH